MVLDVFWVYDDPIIASDKMGYAHNVCFYGEIRKNISRVQLKTSYVPYQCSEEDDSLDTNIVKSTLIISKSKGLSEILRDTCSSTYQI